MLPTRMRRPCRAALLATGAVLLACDPRPPRPRAVPPMGTAQGAAARRLVEFVQALHAGRQDTMAAFVTRRYAPSALGDAGAAAVARGWVGEFYRTGGYSIRRVVRASEWEVEVLATTLAELWLRVTLTADTAPPHRITAIRVAPTPPGDTTRGPPLADAEVVGQLEAYLARLSSADVFSGVVLLVRGDRVLFQRAYGYADRARRRPNRLDTRFNLASLGKTFTSVAVARLVEAGRLSYTTPVGAYLPDYPDATVRERVTIHQLLTHRSGLGDYFRTPRYEARREQLRTVADYVALFADQPLAFEPGTRVQYSNNGYALLGAIVERVAGESFYDHLHGQVFRRAGMNATGYPPMDDPTPDRATGYTHRGVEREPSADPDLRRDNREFLPMRGGPAGGAYSTAADLLRFAAALRAHRLLGPAYTDTVTTVKADEPRGPGLLAREAYGFFDERVRGHRIVSNNGGQAGVNTQLDLYLDTGHTAVVLSNYDGPAAFAVAEKIRALVAQIAPTPRR